VRSQRQFFGDDDERPAKYWDGAGDTVSRQPRFVGWFAFDFRLADDRQPAQVAVESLSAAPSWLRRWTRFAEPDSCSPS
jgi:hypothetical protein